MDDPSSQNALRQQNVATDEQKTRTLQNNICRIEKEVEFLEREESWISTNESFILKTLRAVETSPHDIIKEAQENLVPEPIKLRTTRPGLPESFPLTSQHPEPTSPRLTLVAMEINVCKKPLTGEGPVTPQDLQQHSGVTVYHDGRKCVYALEQQRSHDLSSREVDQLLRAASRHGNTTRALSNHQEEYRHRNQVDSHCHGNQLPRNNNLGGDHHHGNYLQIHSQGRQGEMHLHGYQERERNGSSNVEKGRGPGHDAPSGYWDYNGNHGNPAQAQPAVRTNGGPAPRSHDQEAVSPWRPELCYTPANHIPLRDYVTVEDEELYLYSPPSCHSYSQSEASPNGDSQSTAFFFGPAQSERAPSPLYEADSPFTILSATETTEPITAVFLGFQTTQDESGCGQEYEGSLKAELVIIEDANVASSTVEEKVGYPAGVLANHMLGRKDKGRATGSGSRKIRRQYQACCTIC